MIRPFRMGHCRREKITKNIYRCCLHDFCRPDDLDVMGDKLAVEGNDRTAETSHHSGTAGNQGYRRRENRLFRYRPLK